MIVIQIAEIHQIWIQVLLDYYTKCGSTNSVDHISNLIITLHMHRAIALDYDRIEDSGDDEENTETMMIFIRFFFHMYLLDEATANSLVW